ncbi:MAG: hypothetical protein JWP52_2919 [Rhizobacter sp.]|nr:hypothetical protein [Rhizobacter sp.]
MSLIPAYTFVPDDLERYCRPMPTIPLATLNIFDEFHAYLTALTLAVESGVIDTDRWPEQLFATKADLETFFDGLSKHCAHWRLDDRWHCALMHIAHIPDEVGFNTGEEIVERLHERAFGELKAFTAARARARTTA